MIKNGHLSSRPIYQLLVGRSLVLHSSG